MLNLFVFLVLFSFESEPITGILEKKRATKSQQTMCAGGSDYYILKKGNSEIILQGDTSGFSSQIGKSIRLQGHFENKIVKPSSDPNVQSMTSEVMCSIFVVEKILKKTMLTGIIVKKPWTKSTQSYCAGGSDYYVLKTTDKEIVLQGDEELLAANLGKEVKITGTWETKVIKSNPNEQRPVNPFEEDSDFKCEVYVVESIK